jgi:hypothetical protein
MSIMTASWRPLRIVAVLAAVAMAHGADALVSADGAFASVPELVWIDPATTAVDSLLNGSASGASASDR